ncbi:MAG: 5-(carboxyamino)imidazole ribonucleotide mutase [Chloroflexi bacterium]|nr:5-(carboxyamino)imidazole ribonucleotide mutase [Chloroflexota bacterium]
MPLVGVVIGSRSDEPLVQDTLRILTELGVEHEFRVLSAHRTPQRVAEYAHGASGRGIEVIIAAAGGAAALPGAIAAWTDLPVIGVPLPTSEIKGMDALYAIAQMPPGVPVACVAVGAWGARNAAYLAASILALKHDKIREAYASYRQKLRES